MDMEDLAACRTCGNDIDKRDEVVVICGDMCLKNGLPKTGMEIHHEECIELMEDNMSLDDFS